MEVRACHEEYIGARPWIVLLIMHGQIVYGIAWLPGFGVDALLFMINGITFDYQDSALSVSVFVSLCYLKFFVH